MKTLIKNKGWKTIPLLTAAVLGTTAFSNTANAAFDINLNSDSVQDQLDKISFGGYFKLDVRHVDGDVAYQDYWVANFPGGEAIETSRTGFTVGESRVNIGYQHGDIKAFVEVDFYGGGGNEVVSNSTSPRLRHFKLDYKNWTVGQTWTTFMPLHALPEALDFGGPHVGEVFARQALIRYSTGGWQFAIENPETAGDGDVGADSSAVGLTGVEADPDESIPDFVARYDFRGRWGQLSIGGLARKVDQGGLDETAFSANIAGKINTFGKDDFRFQLTVGEPGRYTSAGLTPDIVIDPTSGETVVEETTAYTLAYKHHWNDTFRSTAYYLSLIHI